MWLVFKFAFIFDMNLFNFFNLNVFVGIACLLLPETATARAAGSFLTHAIMQSPHLQTFIQPVGQELVCVLLQCIGKRILFK